MEEAEGGKVPWTVVRQLPRAEDARGGVLSSRDLAVASALLTEPQLRWLERDEFPVMEHVASWRSLFLLMSGAPPLASRLFSPAGGPMAQIPPQVGSDLAGRLGFDPAAAATASLRIVEKPLSPPESPFREVDLKAQGMQPLTRNVVIQVLAPDGRSLAQQGFLYGGRQPE